MGGRVILCAHATLFVCFIILRFGLNITTDHKVVRQRLSCLLPVATVIVAHLQRAQCGQVGGSTSVIVVTRAFSSLITLA